MGKDAIGLLGFALVMVALAGCEFLTDPQQQCSDTCFRVAELCDGTVPAVCEDECGAWDTCQQDETADCVAGASSCFEVEACWQRNWNSCE